MQIGWSRSKYSLHYSKTEIFWTLQLKVRKHKVKRFINGTFLVTSILSFQMLNLLWMIASSLSNRSLKRAPHQELQSDPDQRHAQFYLCGQEWGDSSMFSSQLTFRDTALTNASHEGKNSARGYSPCYEWYKWYQAGEKEEH